MLVSKKCREFFCIIMCCNLAFPTTVDVISIISNNNRCYFQQQLMSFPTSVDVISNNSQCHFQQQSMSFPSFLTAIDAISNDSRCHFKQQSMSFPTTVDVISNNSRCHFQQQSMSFPATVNVISNNKIFHSPPPKKKGHIWSAPKACSYICVAVMFLAAT